MVGKSDSYLYRIMLSVVHHFYVRVTTGYKGRVRDGREVYAENFVDMTEPGTFT